MAQKWPKKCPEKSSDSIELPTRVPHSLLRRCLLVLARLDTFEPLTFRYTPDPEIPESGPPPPPSPP